MKEEIKVGSQVIISSRYHHGSIATVKRETKLYLIVGGREDRFRKSDLCEPGDGFGRRRISLATNERVKEVMRINLAINLKNKIDRLDFKTLSTEKLNMIKEAINYSEGGE